MNKQERLFVERLFIRKTCLDLGCVNHQVDKDAHITFINIGHSGEIIRARSLVFEDLWISRIRYDSGFTAIEHVDLASSYLQACNINERRNSNILQMFKLITGEGDADDACPLSYVQDF